MVSKRVRGAVFGTGLTIGLLALAIFAAKRSNIGNDILGGLRGFGSNVGQGIIAPFTGLLQGVTEGGESIGNAAVGVSEGFQKSVSSTLGLGQKLFSEIGNGQTTTSSPKPSQILNLSNIFNDNATISRLANQASIAVGKGGTGRGVQTQSSEFGGFGSGANQESELQKAIAESQAKFSQFFNA